jgi:hypothetical protein
MDGFFCLATLRPDGFAGYEPVDPASPAMIVTRPVVCPGKPARSAWLSSALGLVGTIVRIHREEVVLSQELPGHREDTKRTRRLVPHIY